MPIVTGIHEHPKRRGRFSIELDGEAKGVVDVESIAEIGIRVGETLTPVSITMLEVADRRVALLDKSLNLLAVRARSARDLRIRLRRAEAAPPDIGWVLERLTSLGYMDDAAFARGLSRSRVQAGSSRRRVHNELFRHGVSREVAVDAVNEVFAESNVDEYEAALALARKRVRSLAKLDRLTQRRRLYAFLARRGYESATVSRVVRDVLDSDAG